MTNLGRLLDKKFGVLVAGGFGKLKGSMFRVGSMGMIDQTLVSITLDAISQGLTIFGLRVRWQQGAFGCLGNSQSSDLSVSILTDSGKSGLYNDVRKRSL